MAEFLPWRPLRLSLDVERRVEETFTALIHEPWGRALSRLTPAIDVYETPEAFLIEADLPGVPPEKVEVRIEGQRLTICGSRQSVVSCETMRSVQIERARGEFRRSLELGQPVDAGRIETWSEHGLFHARLPKRARQTPRREASFE